MKFKLCSNGTQSASRNPPWSGSNQIRIRCGLLKQFKNTKPVLIASIRLVLLHQRHRCHGICLTRLRIGHTRITHAHFLSKLYPLSYKRCGHDSLLMVEHMYRCLALEPLHLGHQISHSLNTVLAIDLPSPYNIFSYLHAADFLTII